MLKASPTVPPWVFCELSLFSRSFPPLLVPEASCCPGLHEYTAQGNPDKQLAATSEGLAESSCPTSVAGPLRLNKAPERERTKVCLSSIVCLQGIYACSVCISEFELTIWHRERLWLTSFSSNRISISSLPSKAFILSCLLANLRRKDTHILASQSSSHYLF